MATWSDLIGHLRARYGARLDTPDVARLSFADAGERPITVVLSRQRLGPDGHDWVMIEAPFARIDDVEVSDVLHAVAATVCGGAALVGDTMTFRYALPLAAVAPREVDVPLMLVAATAGRLGSACADAALNRTGGGHRG